MSGDRGAIGDFDVASDWVFLPHFVDNCGIAVQVVQQHHERIKVSFLHANSTLLPEIFFLLEEKFVQFDRYCWRKNFEILLPVVTGSEEFVLPREAVLAAREKNSESIYVETRLVSMQKFEKFFSSVVPGAINAAEAEVKYDCFMSHSWGPDNVNHEAVVEWTKKFRERGLSCWIDADCMGRDLISSMAKGIINSKVFVVFLSCAYMEKLNNINSNVFKEFSFATNDKIMGVDRFVLIKQEKGVESFLKNPEACYTFFMSCQTQKRYDFVTPETLEKEFSDCIEEIARISQKPKLAKKE